MILTAVPGVRFMAAAQNQSAATPKDAIFVRKVLMDTVDDKLNRLEMASRSGQLDLDDARDQADTISVLLMAFPHLFPPATNQWKPDGDADPATGTLASPEVWSDFADFYRRATLASNVALRLSRASDNEEFAGLTIQLRVVCDSCHALYLEDQ